MIITIFFATSFDYHVIINDLVLIMHKYWKLRLIKLENSFISEVGSLIRLYIFLKVVFFVCFFHPHGNNLMTELSLLIKHSSEGGISPPLFKSSRPFRYSPLFPKFAIPPGLCQFRGDRPKTVPKLKAAQIKAIFIHLLQNPMKLSQLLLFFINVD